MLAQTAMLADFLLHPAKSYVHPAQTARTKEVRVPLFVLFVLLGVTVFASQIPLEPWLARTAQWVLFLLLKVSSNVLRAFRELTKGLRSKLLVWLVQWVLQLKMWALSPVFLV